MHDKANGRERAVDRLALTVAEGRLDLDLSQRELAQLTGVSRSTIRAIEEGGRVRPEFVTRAALSLVAVELSRGRRTERDYLTDAVMVELEHETVA
jgi:DNA-binding XRE family transcriptional regulator